MYHLANSWKIVNTYIQPTAFAEEGIGQSTTSQMHWKDWVQSNQLFEGTIQIDLLLQSSNAVEVIDQI